MQSSVNFFIFASSSAVASSPLAMILSISSSVMVLSLELKTISAPNLTICNSSSLFTAALKDIIEIWNKKSMKVLTRIYFIMHSPYFSALPIDLVELLKHQGQASYTPSQSLSPQLWTVYQKKYDIRFSLTFEDVSANTFQKQVEPRYKIWTLELPSTGQSCERDLVLADQLEDSWVWQLSG